MFDVAINILEQSLVFFFIYSLSEEHQKYTTVIFIVCWLLSFLLISFINQFSLSQSLLIIIFEIILFVCLRLTTYLSLGKSIVYALLPYTIIAAINTIVDMTVMIFLFPGKTIFDLLTLYQIPFDLFIQFCHAVAFYFIAKYLRNNNTNFSNKEWLLIGCLLALCNIMSTCFETVYLEYDTSKYYLLLGVYCVAIFIVLIFVLFRSLYSHIQLENQQSLKLEILQSQIKSNNKILELRNELSSIRHDMKHFIALLKSENANLNSQEIQDVIDTYDVIGRSPQPIQSINPAINYVLNIKQEEAVQKNLNFVCTLNITRNPEIETSDLYLLLSNLIDNAIQHIGANKTVRVTIKEVQNNLMIQICNSVDGITVDEDGNFIQSEHDESHGHGLRTVQTIVNKYNGYFICEQDADEAVCSIFLPY